MGLPDGRIAGWLFAELVCWMVAQLFGLFMCLFVCWFEPVAGRVNVLKCKQFFLYFFSETKLNLPLVISQSLCN